MGVMAWLECKVITSDKREAKITGILSQMWVFTSQIGFRGSVTSINGWLRVSTIEYMTVSVYRSSVTTSGGGGSLRRFSVYLRFRTGIGSDMRAGRLRFFTYSLHNLNWVVLMLSKRRLRSWKLKGQLPARNNSRHNYYHLDTQTHTNV